MNDNDVVKFTAIIETPPVLNRSGHVNRETEGLITAARTAVADVPRGTWVRIFGPGSRKRCESFQQRLSAHKKPAGRVPVDLTASVRELHDGGFYLYVMLREPRKG